MVPVPAGATPRELRSRAMAGTAQVMVEVGPSTWYLAGGGGWGRGTLACRLGRWGRRGRRRRGGRRGKRVEEGSHVLWVEEHLGNRGVGGGEV